MDAYHKINSLFFRDLKTHKLLIGQYCDPVFKCLEMNRWSFQEKIDGMNIRVMWDGQEVRFRGRTDNAHIPGELIERLTSLFPAEKCKEVFGQAACLYGEGYGRGIGANGKLYGITQEFILFDVHIRGLWLEKDNLLDVGRKLNVKVAPFIGNGTLLDAVGLMRTNLWSEIADTWAEGIVVRPECDLRARDFKRIIGKVRVEDFR